MSTFPRLHLRDPAIELVDLPWEKPLADCPATKLAFLLDMADPERADEMLLAVTTKSEHWLQATIHPEEPVVGQDITTGRYLDPQTASTLQSEGDDCVVSLDYGTISLEAPPA